MATYKFPEWKIEIVNPTVIWTFAGFYTEGDGLMQVNVLLTTKDGTNFRVSLQKVGQAVDRSDEAIEALMNYLLEPYIVE